MGIPYWKCPLCAHTNEVFRNIEVGDMLTCFDCEEEFTVTSEIKKGEDNGCTSQTKGETETT